MHKIDCCIISLNRKSPSLTWDGDFFWVYFVIAVSKVTRQSNYPVFYLVFQWTDIRLGNNHIVNPFMCWDGIGFTVEADLKIVHFQCIKVTQP